MAHSLTLLGEGRLELLHGLEVELGRAEQPVVSPDPVIEPEPRIKPVQRRVQQQVWQGPVRRPVPKDRDFADLLEAATRAAFDRKPIYRPLDGAWALSLAAIAKDH